VSKLVKTLPEKDKSWRDLIYFPIIYYIISLFFAILLFAISPEYLADHEELNTVLYSAVFITHWLLAFLVIRRLKRQDLSLKEFIAPRKKTRIFPAILVFVSLNALFTTYMVLALTYGRIQPWRNLNAFQLVYFVAAQPLTAGFVEELIWRGYFVEKLLRMGNSEWRSIIFSSISFAFIHGFWLVDKLAVTFLFGIIAGAYYVRERNLVVLMVTHVTLDIVAFALAFLA